MTVDTADEVRPLRRWMLAVGIFYIVMGVRLLPFVNGPMIEELGMLDSIYTGGDLEVGTPAFSFVLDWMATFGLTLLPFGAALVVAARDPVRNRLFAHLVIWHEIVVGVVDDLWFISRDYVSDMFYVGFIIVHLVVIATGVRALRRASVGGAPTAATVQDLASVRADGEAQRGREPDRGAAAERPAEQPAHRGAGSAG